jgi:zinc transporter
VVRVKHGVDALSALSTTSHAAVPSEQRTGWKDLRQAAEEFSAAVGDSVALAERLKLPQEELAATVSEHINRSLFILTLVTVLALPINLVAGLRGMNVELRSVP